MLVFFMSLAGAPSTTRPPGERRGTHCSDSSITDGRPPRCFFSANQKVTQKWSASYPIGGSGEEGSDQNAPHAYSYGVTRNTRVPDGISCRDHSEDVYVNSPIYY